MDTEAAASVTGKLKGNWENLTLVIKYIQPFLANILSPSWVTSLLCDCRALGVPFLGPHLGKSHNHGYFHHKIVWSPTSIWPLKLLTDSSMLCSFWFCIFFFFLKWMFQKCYSPFSPPALASPPLALIKWHHFPFHREIRCLFNSLSALNQQA